MIDIHPPQHAAITRRDFFIHLFIVVLGILIAIGLEQVAEQIHQHYQLRETREALARERDANRADVQLDMQHWLFAAAEFRNNLVVLQYVRQHPGTPQTALPGDLQWLQYAFHSEQAVWNAAQQNGLVRLMPIDEANRALDFYEMLAVTSQQSLDTWNADNDAHTFDLIDSDPTHLSPQQLDQAIRLTEIVLEKHIEQGYTLARVAETFPDMPQLVTYDKISALRPTPFDLSPSTMAAAHQRTSDLVNAAMKETR
jgi:hypothetical protein